MNKHLMLSASDLALTAGDTPDLPSTGSAFVKLLAPLSQELDTSSDSFLANAHAGDFVIYTGGSEPVVINGVAGFICMVLGFERPWIEYGRTRDDTVRHAKRLPDAVWLDRGEKGVERPGEYRIDPNGEVGNRVVKTVIAYLLIDGVDEVVTYYFQSTALKVGNAFIDVVQKLAIRSGPDGLQWIAGCTLGRWRVTSRIAESGSRRWHLPKVALIGRLGEEGGPSLEEWRRAQGLRIAAKAPTPVPLASAPTHPALVRSEIEAPAPPSADDGNLVPEHYPDDVDPTEEI
jgi:hypothetical protein